MPPQSLRYDHTIDEDGYNVGRDLMVASSVQGGRWKTFEWKADVEWVEGLLAPGKHGECQCRGPAGVHMADDLFCRNQSSRSARWQSRSPNSQE